MPGIVPSLPPACPHQQIIEIYHEVLPELNQVKVWNEARRKMLQKRWREDSKRQRLDWWRGYFEFVRECPLLMGNHESKSHEGWAADLEWLVRPNNFAKVIEGKYQEVA